MSTTTCSDIEHNKLCGEVSTIMKVMSNKDGDLLSQFDNINENDIPVLERLLNLPAHIRDTSQQEMLMNNHTDPNKGKTKGWLYLEGVFGFCKSFKKVIKLLCFHLMLKTNDLQDIIKTSMEDDINVTINILYLLVPNLPPSVETQVMFSEATQKNYKIAYDEYFYRKTINIRYDCSSRYRIGATSQWSYIINFCSPNERLNRRSK